MDEEVEEEGRLSVGVITMLNKRSLCCVRGSYSARVPRSSLAEVHREFVHHILEDEVDGQKEGQGEKRENGEERSVVEKIRQTHQMNMKHEME